MCGSRPGTFYPGDVSFLVDIPYFYAFNWFVSMKFEAVDKGVVPIFCECVSFPFGLFVDLLH